MGFEIYCTSVQGPDLERREKGVTECTLHGSETSSLTVTVRQCDL